MATDHGFDLLGAKLSDGLLIGRKRPWFLGFLTEEEQAFCADRLKYQRDALAQFWGGYEESERRVLGIFPDYGNPPLPEDYPVSALTISYRAEATLTHRDFLGAILSLGLQRDVVGDILPAKGKAVVFLRAEMSDYVLRNLAKVGRTGVKITPGVEEPLPLEREFQELSGVVASQRLDCLVAFAGRCSREKAAGMIAQGLVMLNHRQMESGSQRVKEGDILSLRGHGKFSIDKLGPPTTKGRLAVRCRKYK